MTPMPIMLRQFQRSVEQLHDVETDLDVNEYIVGDEVRDSIDGSLKHIPEQLFVRETGDEFELALYIAPRIVENLNRHNPLIRLHHANIESFCIALEGVSHFVFFVWCASVGRNITPLELEIQAEVDKFVTAWLLLMRQGKPLCKTGNPLLKKLFGAFVLHRGLSPQEVDRYRMANEVALRFCTKLVEEFSREPNAKKIEAQSRTFYRRSLDAKLRA